MVKFLTEQGFTVFMVSWRNPDASMENTTIEEYLDLGLLAPRDVVQEIAESSYAECHGILHRRHAARDGTCVLGDERR